MNTLHKSGEVHSSGKKVKKSFDDNKGCEGHCMGDKKNICNKFDRCNVLVGKTIGEIEIIFSI